MTVATDKQVDLIKANAFDGDHLLERAMLDAVEAFARFATAGRTRSESIRLLRHWQNVFERHTHERTRRHP